MQAGFGGSCSVPHLLHFVAMSLPSSTTLSKLSIVKGRVSDICFIPFGIC